jgi:hypothetical protein
MGEHIAKCCDICGALAKKDGFTHELHGVDLKLLTYAEPIWGNVQWALAFKGEACPACLAAVVEKIGSAFAAVKATREATTREDNRVRTLCFDIDRKMKMPWCVAVDDVIVVDASGKDRRWKTERAARAAGIAHRDRAAARRK